MLKLEDPLQTQTGLPYPNQLVSSYVDEAVSRSSCSMKMESTFSQPADDIFSLLENPSMMMDVPTDWSTTSSQAENVSVNESATSSSFVGASFRCFICHQIFDTQRFLNSHISKHFISRVRTAEEMAMDGGSKRRYDYKCLFCNYATIIPCNMVRHSKIHSGDKPFACGYCDKKFIEKKAMEIHVRSQHTKPNLGMNNIFNPQL